MSTRQPADSQSPRLADRLAAARRVRFIARRHELALFASALAADDPPFTVLHVHGPGGVGKSTLLREFARLAHDAQRPVLALDGRDLQPTADAVRRAIEEAAGLAADVPEASARIPDRSVLLIDTYEALSPLDAWFRDTFLPELPGRVIVVFAGRKEPALPWRTDVAWAPLTHAFELGNFEQDDSVAFLASRAIAPAAHAGILEFTRGHPLALALVTDVLTTRPTATRFDPQQAPDVVRHLLALFLDRVPAGRQREALDTCAIARVTNEALLVALFGAEEGVAAFHWLRRQSFIDSGPRGLFPHDLVRELLIADAAWRDATALRQLSRRIYAATCTRLAGASDRERQRVQMDALYVTRLRPSNIAFFDWRAMDDVRVEPAAAEDDTWMAEVARRHEGAAAAELLQWWRRAQPAAFHVFRDAREARFGFLVLLDIAGVDATTAARDPAIAAARAFVAQHGSCRPGDAVLYLRWWMHEEAYQAITPAINLTAMHVVSRCVTQPNIAWNFVAIADPAFWTAHFDGVNFARATDADFSIAGRRYGVFAHDWRVEPPAEWMMGTRIAMPFATTRTAAAATAVHTEAAFRDAVRGALRDYTRPERLAMNPLRGARLLQGVPAGDPAARAIRTLLREAAAALQTNPRDMKLYRAVWLTYFEPLETQEQVAERLGLPFSTFRHHLGRGIERIAAWLWHRERSARTS